MASRYMPIPSDSDNEDNNMSDTAPMSDSDNGSDRSRSTERSHLLSQAVSVSLAEEDPEEEPEEDNPTRTDYRSPMPTFNFGMRPSVRRTARKHVAMPNPIRWTRPQPPEPSADPYYRSAGDSQGWGRTLNTLRRWKNAGQIPHSFGEEGPSTAQYEPILDTTPIIVDRIDSQENRIDIMEDAIMVMPGSEAFGELQEQVNNADENISAVNDTAQDLKKQTEATTRKLKSMELTMEKFDRRISHHQTMASIIQEYEAHIAREEYKKDKEK